MSEANVEIVRRAWEAHARHDNESAFRFYAPEVEVQSALGEVYRGVDGVREFFRWFIGTLDDRGEEVKEWIDAGDEVIAVMRISGRGRRSGIPVEQEEFHVWTVRNGKLLRLRVYTHRSDALKAAGLDGQAMSQANLDLVRSIYAAWEEATSARRSGRTRRSSS